MPATLKGTITIDGQELTVTNPEKPLWPEMGITKRIYLQKLAALSPYLLTYCKNRLLTVIRYLHGVPGMSFYQKCPQPRPGFIRLPCRTGSNILCCTACRSCYGWGIWLRWSSILLCITPEAACPVNG